LVEQSNWEASTVPIKKADEKVNLQDQTLEEQKGPEVSPATLEQVKTAVMAGNNTP